MQIPWRFTSTGSRILPDAHAAEIPSKNFANPLDAFVDHCYTAPVFRRSSAVEQLTVNQLVVGSIPTAGAKDFKDLALIR